MPTYEYKCEACAFHFEIERSIHLPLLTQCPECFEEGLSQIFGVPFVYCYGEARTVEHVSDRNIKRVGEDYLRERAEKNREARIKKIENMKVPDGGSVISPKEAQTPWWRKGIHGTPVSDKPIDLDKIKDTDKFIKTGRTD